MMRRTRACWAGVPGVFGWNNDAWKPRANSASAA